MKYIETQFDKFTIVGISVRTTNRDAKAQYDIAELWKRFLHENILDQIPDKASDDVYCLYTDYDTDFMGDYTTVIGCLVASVRNIPEGLIIKEIPESKYYGYRSEGKLPGSILKTWKHIWMSNDINRRYTADFDVYGVEARDSENAVVMSYVAVK